MWQLHKLESISIKDHKNSTVVSRESKSEQFIAIAPEANVLFNFSQGFHNGKLVEKQYLSVPSVKVAGLSLCFVLS